MRVVKVSPVSCGLSGPWMAFDAEKEIEEILNIVKELIPEVAEGDSISLHFEEMDKEEFEKLPEFPGW